MASYVENLYFLSRSSVEKNSSSPKVDPVQAVIANPVQEKKENDEWNFATAAVNWLKNGVNSEKLVVTSDGREADPKGVEIAYPSPKVVFVTEHAAEGVTTTEVQAEVSIVSKDIVVFPTKVELAEAS